MVELDGLVCGCPFYGRHGGDCSAFVHRSVSVARPSGVEVAYALSSNESPFLAGG